VGARTRAQLDRAIGLIAAGDRETFAQLVATDPDIFILREGVEVIAVDAGRVRQRGEGAPTGDAHRVLDRAGGAGALNARPSGGVSSPPPPAQHIAEPERRGICRETAAYFPVGSSDFAARVRYDAKIAASGSTTELRAALVFDSTLGPPSGPTVRVVRLHVRHGKTQPTDKTIFPSPGTRIFSRRRPAASS
jgi:hypothetical protein